MPSSRAHALRRARIPVALLVLGVLVAVLYGFSHAVEVVVDGETHQVRTYAGSVGEVLDTLDVEVGSAEEVPPAPSAPLTEGLTIDVDRAITVDVAVGGGVARRVTAPVDAVGEVLELADLGHVDERGAIVEPAVWTPVEDGDVVRVELPTRVWVEVDGKEWQVDTHASRVGGALRDAGVELGAEDVVLRGEDRPLVGPTTVVVQRVETETVVEEVAVEHEEVRRETAELLEGTTKVDQDGRDGLREETYEVTTVDGRETRRELVSEELVEEPRDEVVLVGTGTPTPEPAEVRTAAGGGTVWDALAKCESGGNWSHRGGRYHGGLQFHPGTWRAHKPGGYPAFAYQATREQQIAVGKRVQQSQGWGAWPHCSRVVGLR